MTEVDRCELVAGACVAAVYWLEELLSTPFIAESVFGVIVAFAELELLFMRARNAAVFGEGGGKETGPPTRGVKPVPGVRPVRGVKPVRGVRPVRNEAGSNGRCGALSEPCWGPASMAGESGPARRELARDVENCQV